MVVTLIRQTLVCDSGVTGAHIGVFVAMIQTFVSELGYINSGLGPHVSLVAREEQELESVACDDLSKNGEFDGSTDSIIPFSPLPPRWCRTLPVLFVSP